MLTQWFDALRERGQQRFFKFIDKRVRPQSQHLLTRDKLYIFPSKRGFAFIGIILILWLLGTNYQNNLVLGLAFLLTSIFIVAILQTHANLAALSVKFSGVPSVHAGEQAQFTFTLQVRAKRYAENIEMAWQDERDSVVNIDIPPNESVKVVVPAATFYRGWLQPGRMRVQSFYPLGVLRCWSWLNWDINALIYPEPIKREAIAAPAAEGEGDGQHPMKGGEDYSGLKNYIPGDSLKQIAWKHFAQERGLFVKEFSQNLSKERWLDLDAIPGSNLEERISALCYWALQFDIQDEYYGLKLPTKTVAPDKGENHRRAVLEALATYAL